MTHGSRVPLVQDPRLPDNRLRRFLGLPEIGANLEDSTIGPRAFPGLFQMAPATATVAAQRLSKTIQALRQLRENRPQDQYRLALQQPSISLARGLHVRRQDQPGTTGTHPPNDLHISLDRKSEPESREAHQRQHTAAPLAQMQTATTVSPSPAARPTPSASPQARASAQLAPSATPPQQPPAIQPPPIPEYVSSSGKVTNRIKSEDDWRKFHHALRKRNATPSETEVFALIFSAEGGSTPDKDEDTGAVIAVSGITATILKDLHAVDFHRKKLEAAGIRPSDSPETLSREQRIEVYRVYMDEVIGPAKVSQRRAHTNSTASPPVRGFELLEATLNNTDALAAVTDTLVREGGTAAPIMIQKAINRTMANTGQASRVAIGGGIGSDTLSKMSILAADPEHRRQLIDNILDLRLQHHFGTKNFNGEAPRINSYRIP